MRIAWIHDLSDGYDAARRRTGYNGDRFVPLGDGVYCYSRHGCRRAWLLPPALRGRPLELFTLSAAGRGAAPEHRLEGDHLTLALAPRVPAKVIAKEGS